MDKKEVKLDLTNNLVNLSNSILKFYNCTTFHPSLKRIDELFSKQKNKKICVLLYDGMGKNIFEKYKEDIPFLYSHIYHQFESIFPPTTVAATTALLTGLYPNENGFVGWNQYFKQIDKFVDVFTNKESIVDQKIDHDVSSEFLTPTFIDKLINEKNKANIAKIIQSFQFKNRKKHDDFNTFFKEVDKSLKKYNFIYAYSSEPDHSMHDNGIKNEHVLKKIKYLEEKTIELVNNNKDTLFILVADHGFKDVEYLPLYLDNELISCLSERNKKQIFTIEPRFASFFVRNKEKFIEIYKNKYQDYFLLYTKEELLNSEIIGENITKINQNTLNTLGDYILLATSSYMFVNKEDPSFKMKGAHAGVSKEEKELYLCVFNN